MSGITLVSVNPELEEAFLRLFGRSVSVRRVWSDQWRDPVEATMDVCAADPEVLVIGSDMPREKARLLVPEVDRRFPTTATVVLVETHDPEYALDLLRLGARDVIDDDVDNPPFRSDIERVLEVARARRQTSVQATPTRRRRVITVVSPKGGTGKTTIATNLAVGLVRRQPNQVVLLDLDTQFGDCAAALGLKPEHSLVEAMRAMSHERSAMKIFLTLHSSGLALLSAPEDLSQSEDIEPDQLKALVTTLAEEFPFAVIDTSAGIDPACLAAMELSTDLLFVASTDVPAIRALRRQIDALDRIGMVSQRRTLVLNRANAKVGLSAADVEAAVGLPVDFEIPSTRVIPVSTNEGVTVIERDSGNVARKFEDIANYFAPRTDETRGSRWSLRKDR